MNIVGMTRNRAPRSVFHRSGPMLKKGHFYPPGGGGGGSRDPIFEANLTILGVHARPQERLVVGGRVFNQALLRRGEGGDRPPPPPPPPPVGGGGGAKCNP